MKTNKGITLITLIITIVVIIILASITIYYGMNTNLERADETKTVQEVYEIIDAVNNRALLNKINPDFYDYRGDNTFVRKEVGNNTNKKTYYSDDGWYLVEREEDFKELGLENIKDEKYLINYEDGLVVDINGVMYKEKEYFLLNEIKVEMGGGSTVVSNTEYDKNKKVNKPVLSKGMVPVKLSGGKWVVTSTDDEGWYDYSKDQQAWANVMLMDNLTVVGYTNEAIREASLSELVGKEVEKEGSAYVWIPRYTSNGSKIIFSNLTVDTTSANGETYTVQDSFIHEKGTSNEIQLTGIWVSKYEAGFDK